MEFVAFHLMPYAVPDIADVYDAMDIKSAWVLLSNEHFDSKQGVELYKRYLEELCYAEELGFDVVAVNEHHQNAWGTMPSPNVMAAALTQRVERARIAILGNAISLHEQPQRIAEEIGMLDLLSNGRMICGFVRGIGFESTSLEVNPVFSRERFIEAHDLITRAWTESGPFAYHGEHYHFDYVNPWPTPVQQPHPPIWMPSQGSAETVEWTAKHRYTYLQSFTPLEKNVQIAQQYRDAAESFGYTAGPEKLGWGTGVYVAETDEKAMEEARPHVDVLFNKFLVAPLNLWFPPGYLAEHAHKAGWAARSAHFTRTDQTLEELCEAGLMVVGSPETVTRRLKEAIDRVGVGILVPIIQIATMPHHLTMKSLRLFGEEVMPQLRNHVSEIYR